MTTRHQPRRRVVHGGAHGYVVFSRAPEMIGRIEFERLALMSDRIAVIDGEVIEPYSSEAVRAKATGCAP